MYAETLSEVTAVFKEQDKAKTGKLNKQQLQAGLEKCGVQIKNEELADIFKQCDANNDGQIDFHEFVAGLSKLYK